MSSEPFSQIVSLTDVIFAILQAFKDVNIIHFVIVWPHAAPGPTARRAGPHACVLLSELAPGYCLLTTVYSLQLLAYGFQLLTTDYCLKLMQ